MTQEDQPLPESPHLGVDGAPVHQRVGPGEKAIYAITIENRSDEAQTQSLELQGLPQEWYTLEFAERRVAFPREQRSATLIVSVPEDAQLHLHRFRVVARAGAEESAVQCSLEVLAQSGAALAGPSEPQTETEGGPALPLPPGVTLSPTLVTWEGETGEEERLAVTVRNVGNQDAEYSVFVEGLAADWYTLPPKVRVPAGEGLETQLRIHPPARAKSGDYLFKVRVAVDEHPDIAAETQGHLTVSPPEPKPRRRPPPPAEEPTKAEAPKTPDVSKTPVLPPEVSLAPRTTFRFSPGEVSAQAIITVANKSRLIERYELQVLGIPEEWYGLSTFDLRLDPGGTAQVPLRLTPRPGPGHPAGEYSFRVKVAPHRFPDSFAEVGARITIIGVPAFDARLSPAQSQGRKEKFKLTLVNTGAVPLSLWMEGSDPEGMCKFKFPPPPNLDPGQEAVVPVWVGAQRNGLLGPPETFDFRLRVSPAGAESTAAKAFDARFVHKPFLSLRFAFLSLFLALLATIVGVVIALGPPRIGDGFTWIGCRIDDDYQKVKGGFVFRKQECGGAPEAEQSALAQGTPIATPAAVATGTAGPNGCQPAGNVRAGIEVEVIRGTRIRESAGTSGAVLDTLGDARQATVLEGYQCADGLTWWKVKAGNLEGWAAERDEKGTQLLVPR